MHIIFMDFIGLLQMHMLWHNHFLQNLCRKSVKIGTPKITANDINI